MSLSAFLAPRPRTGSLGVAVSGGVDSMVLLDLLADHNPVVLCVDHGLRPESVQELNRVEELAMQRGLEFRGVRLHLSGGAGKAARAREARYAWFEAQGLDTIALGHHADDQTETVVEHLARGSGARGLAGMTKIRGRYWRPLLAITRQEILAHAVAEGLWWVEDPSNTDGLRGALRHSLLPQLESLRPGAGANIRRAAAHLAEDDAFLTEQARALLDGDVLPVAAFAAPPALARRAVLQLLARHRLEATGRRVDQVIALDRLGARIELKGAHIVRDLDCVRVLPPPPSEQRVTGAWGVWRVHAPGPVEVRPPRAGERIGGTPLRERLRAARISPVLRPYHPVIETSHGPWVPGVWNPMTNSGPSGVPESEGAPFDIVAECRIAGLGCGGGPHTVRIYPPIDPKGPEPARSR